jgi:site-specific recombinase XerD
VAASLFKTSARCLLTLCNTAWKDRHIPLVDEEVKALRNYLRYRASQLVLDDDIFFLAKNGTSLNVSTVKYIVAKYVKKAGIRKKVSVHTLRHTFGAHKADKNMGIATLRLTPLSRPQEVLNKVDCPVAS